MDISEIVKKSGVPASTLRFYEAKGLINSIGRHGLRRQYSPKVLDQLALVTLGQVAGFSLDEIGQMLTPNGQPNIDRQMLSAKADEIDDMVKRLAAMSDGLRHAAACPAPSHSECPTFQRLLQEAACGVLDKPNRDVAKKSNGKFK